MLYKIIFYNVKLFNKYNFLLICKDVKKEISQTKNQIIMIEICKASEKAKIESSLAELNSYKENFELFFEKGRLGYFIHITFFYSIYIITSVPKCSYLVIIQYFFIHYTKYIIQLLKFIIEREISELYNKEVREKEAEHAELERQKQEKLLKLNEQKAKEVVAIENECDSVERECSILTVIFKIKVFSY